MPERFIRDHQEPSRVGTVHPYGAYPAALAGRRMVASSKPTTEEAHAVPPRERGLSALRCESLVERARQLVRPLPGRLEVGHHLLVLGCPDREATSAECRTRDQLMSAR